MDPALSPKSPTAELQTVYELQSVVVDVELPQVVQRIIGLFDGQRTASEVLQDARISEGVGVAVIRKLTRDAMIRPVVSALECADTLRDLPSLRRVQQENAGHFSDEEEAFFASEVQPDEELHSPTLRERLSLLWTDLVIDWA